MKIIFISNKFPPISCGVGDYTYKLAKCLSKKGIYISILCSNYKEIEKSVIQFKKYGIKVFPIVKSWDQKGLDNIQNFFNKEHYDWVSIQYVPYSFSENGIPFFFVSNLKKIFGNVNYHIMYHELWVGKQKRTALKLKFIGSLQKLAIKNMKLKLNPKIVHTHSEVYIKQLNSIGFNVKKLPIPSNINKLNYFDYEFDKKKEFYTFFGNIRKNEKLEPFFVELKTIYKNKDVTPVINLIGNTGPHTNYCIDLLQTLNIEYENYGFRSQKIISEILNSTAYGISTTPHYLFEKSGAVAAMIQHNVKVVSVSRDIQNMDINENNFSYKIQKYEVGSLKNILTNKLEENIYKDIEWISEKFLSDINNYNN